MIYYEEYIKINKMVRNSEIEFIPSDILNYIKKFESKPVKFLMSLRSGKEYEPWTELPKIIKTKFDFVDSNSNKEPGFREVGLSPIFNCAIVEKPKSNTTTKNIFFILTFKKNLLLTNYRSKTLNN